MSYWMAAGIDFKKDLTQKVESASYDLVDYLENLNRYQGVEGNVEIAEMQETYLKDFRTAAMGIPSSVRTRANRKLIGIFTVAGLGSAGLTIPVLENGKVAGSIVAIDLGVVAKNANDWFSERESLPFTGEDIKIEGRIEDDLENNRVSTIRYVLLHELAHVIASNERIYPNLEEIQNMDRGVSNYKFLDMSWTGTVGSYESRFDLMFNTRNKLSFYKKTPKTDKLDSSKIPKVYGSLAKTNFPDLYASSNYFEDFAEGFALFVHTQLLGKPLLISLMRNGKLISSVKNCFDEARCDDKKWFFKSLLSQI